MVIPVCMESISKQTIKQNTNEVVLYIGSNDLRLTKEPLEIASNIVDLTKTWKENDCDAIISNILLDGNKLKKIK